MAAMAAMLASKALDDPRNTQAIADSKVLTETAGQAGTTVRSGLTWVGGVVLALLLAIVVIILAIIIKI